MSNEAEEKLIFSFKIDNCEKDYYYQISMCDEKENFETKKVKCEVGGELISFSNKMNFNFLFEKRQKITMIISKKNFYEPEGSDYGNAKIIYISKLVMSEGGKYEIELNDKDYNSEKILVKIEKNKEEIEKKYLFDYFKSGIKLSCYISFDFSQKNKANIKDANLSILKNIFQYIEDYTSDNLYYSSGFGAKLNDSKIPVFEFDNVKLNSDQLLEKYNVFLDSKNVVPEKKIALSHLIKKITKDIYKVFDANIYNVLFILLSGSIDKKDKEKIINQIIASGYLPLSIVIIFVGNHGFAETKEMFEKSHKYASNGMEKIRNNVIFTSLNSPSGANKCISFCLKELSKQMIEYYIYTKFSTVNEDEKEEEKKDNHDSNKDKIKQSIGIFEKINEQNEIIELKPPTPGNSIQDSNTDSINSSSNSNNVQSNSHNIEMSKNPNGKYILESSIVSAPSIPFNNPFQSQKNDNSVSTKSSDLKNSDN